ncbi:MAG: 4-hydroxy-tetrahydrodipicolinate reductase [Steroidobacteraceae bacterium]
MPKIAVFGITGRMGQCLVRALRAPPPAIESPERLQLSGALASAASAHLGQDAALEGPATGVRITADARAALGGAGVALDFSLPQGIAEHAQACLERRVALLVGTTGFDAATRRELESAARAIAVLIAPNTSLGVAVMTHLLEVAARALGGYDAEIIDVHHRMKHDAPSGTALAWGEAIARARGAELAQLAVFDRHGSPGARRPGSIGFVSLRAGEVVGEHTAMLAADGERVELTHRVEDRMVFARGALSAAAWLAGRPPGLYGMKDVLGF